MITTDYESGNMRSYKSDEANHAGEANNRSCNEHRQQAGPNAHPACLNAEPFGHLLPSRGHGIERPGKPQKNRHRYEQDRCHNPDLAP